MHLRLDKPAERLLPVGESQGRSGRNCGAEQRRRGGQIVAVLTTISEVLLPTYLPRDNWNNTIQTLRPVNGTGQVLAVTAGASSRSTAFASDRRVVRVVATVDVWLATGTASVVAGATSAFVPAGVIEIPSLGPPDDRHLYVAASAVSAPGAVYVIEME